jgi:cation:H+ antiporter
MLIAGAELLVRGATGLARRFGMSELLIGMTIVAFGTSLPELLVSVYGGSDVALGNVVGSNIANVLFILGLSSVITPLVIRRALVRREIPLVIVVSAVAYGLAWNGVISQLEGGLLLAGFGLYSYLTWSQLEEVPEQVKGADLELYKKTDLQDWSSFYQSLVILVGLCLLAGGAHFLVEGVRQLALSFAVSETIISLSIVAVGTSLPELATSAVASMRGNADIAVGNVVGSSIFNLLFVLGVAALFNADGLTVSRQLIGLDFPVMIAVAVACLPVAFSGSSLDRWEGAIFLVYYTTYVVYLYLFAVDHRFLTRFSWITAVFTIPLTTLTLGVIFHRARRDL